MIFHVSDSGVFKSGLFVDISSSPKANSKNALAPDNTSSVSIKSDSTDSSAARVLKGMGPAYLVDISSEGQAALNALKSLNEGMNKFVQPADINNETFSEPLSDVNTIDVSEDNTVNSLSDNDNVNVIVEDESAKSYVNTNNLSRFSEYQLKQMVNDGSITRTDMNDELEKRNKSE